jgi:hypothetical protein
MVVLFTIAASLYFAAVAHQLWHLLPSQLRGDKSAHFD